MKLILEQSAFLLDVCELVRFAHSQEVLVTGGELWRPWEMQEIYLRTGRAKTMKSSHLNRLAIDLNFFRAGKLLQSREEVKPFGDWWEGRNKQNRWGGSWRGLVEAGKSDFIDCPHFERQL